MSRRRVIVWAGRDRRGCAYYLAKRDWKSPSSTAAAMRMAVPTRTVVSWTSSHILPLNEPGVVSKTLRGMFSKHSGRPPQAGLGMGTVEVAVPIRPSLPGGSGARLGAGLRDPCSIPPRGSFRNCCARRSWIVNGSSGVACCLPHAGRDGALRQTDRWLREKFGVAAKRL